MFPKRHGCNFKSYENSWSFIFGVGTKHLKTLQNTSPFLLSLWVDIFLYCSSDYKDFRLFHMYKQDL